MNAAEAITTVSDPADWQLWIAYIAVLLLGGFTGAMELVSRYRDQPQKAVFSEPGIAYWVLNALLSLLTLWVLLMYAADQEASGAYPRGTELFELTCAAGLGALLFFRAKVFTLRVSDTDISVGPSFVLDTLMNAVDNAVARNRAAPRNAAVDRIMDRVSFHRSRVFLPSYCIALLNNVSLDEERRLNMVIASLQDSDMPDGVKARMMGLYLFDLTGAELLEKAVTTLKPWLATEEDTLSHVVERLQKSENGDPIRQLFTYARQIGPVEDTVMDDLEVTLEGIIGGEISDDAKTRAAAVEIIRTFGVGTAEAAARALDPSD